MMPACMGNGKLNGNDQEKNKKKKRLLEFKSKNMRCVVKILTD